MAVTDEDFPDFDLVEPSEEPKDDRPHLVDEDGQDYEDVSQAEAVLLPALGSLDADMANSVNVLWEARVMSSCSFRNDSLPKLPWERGFAKKVFDKSEDTHWLDRSLEYLRDGVLVVPRQEFDQKDESDLRNKDSTRKSVGSVAWPVVAHRLTTVELSLIHI